MRGLEIPYPRGENLLSRGLPIFGCAGLNLLGSGSAVLLWRRWVDLGLTFFRLLFWSGTPLLHGDGRDLWGFLGSGLLM